MRVTGALLLLAGLLSPLMHTAAAGPAPDEVRAAVSRAIPLIEKSMAEYSRQRNCFGCHHQGLGLFALSLARERGFRVDETVLQSQVKFTQASLRGGLEGYRQGRGQGGQVDTAGYALLALESAASPPDEVTEAVAGYLLSRDQETGHWRAQANRPPSEKSSFTATYLALRALKAFGPEARKEEIGARVERALRWLSRTPPEDTEDRVFRLLALHAAGAEDGEIRQAGRDLLESRREDGGWAQLQGMESDAYATGSALVALRLTGQLEPDAAPYRSGLAFLTRTQLADGSWLVRTRVPRTIQIYFESGFPHGKDQFISVSATCWATLALAGSRPAGAAGQEKRP